MPASPVSLAPPPALADMLAAVEAVITQAIGDSTNDRLRAGMTYAVLGGGKRIRAQLAIATTAMLAPSPTSPTHTQPAIRVAASYECLHAYSLVHDDLPAMDNAQTRRGKPACHIAFDEATAILVGDALQSLAFQLLADPATHPDADTRTHLIQDLASAAGTDGMAGGQMRDMLAVTEAFDLATTRQMQAMKTGALITGAVRAGGHITQASAATMMQLTALGEAIGAAFQIADDILDEIGEADTLGKPTSQDKPAAKATLVAHLGLAAARQEAARLVASAQQQLAEIARLNPNANTAWADYLSALFDYIVHREN